ncbi:ABC transporter substrate-binding protein [Luteipulveratus mongoliensis]|uniref:Fe/B12 periplasmic-binding domain-containing protein n=1 Tax=Luteipulveratus mongoliensis TaxID=571913 RepID=A0A0K1JFC6_9MICO|nr:ABC transporter substrate-binding protein [Luteipulveratus mongoliensis]AKU15283.1 hypothetical protein VV02_04430 [Luteipulveratus mongoliensis]
MAHLRTITALSAAALVAVSLSACGSESDASEPGSQPPATSGGGAAGGAFPATVKTSHGDVTIKSRPTKIVTLDDPSLDVAQSVGAPVVMATPGQLQPGKPEPWLVGKYTGKYDASLMNKDFSPNVEKIAALQPDLILSGAMSIKPEAYKQLSTIAPVVGDLTPNDNWDARVRQLATATGTTAKVPGVLADVKKAYAATGVNLAGKTYQWLRFDGSSSSFSPGNGSWLEGYGMKPGNKQDNSMRARDVFSLENLDQMNADVVYVWNYGGDPKKVEADPRFKTLPSVKKGTFVWSDPPLAFSVNTPGPNALKWAIARTQATLKKAQNS